LLRCACAPYGPRCKKIISFLLNAMIRSSPAYSRKKNSLMCWWTSDVRPVCMHNHTSILFCKKIKQKQNGIISYCLFAPLLYTVLPYLSSCSRLQNAKHEVISRFLTLRWWIAVGGFLHKGWCTLLFLGLLSERRSHRYILKFLSSPPWTSMFDAVFLAENSADRNIIHYNRWFITIILVPC